MGCSGGPLIFVIVLNQGLEDLSEFVVCIFNERDEIVHCGSSEEFRFDIGRRKVGYTIRLPLSGMKIQDIKEACGVSEEHMSVGKEEHTAIIQAVSNETA